MKKIGAIGGMSWESSKEYYNKLNELVRVRLGGLHSAKVVLYSIDFVDLEENQRKSNWRKATKIIVDVAKKLESIGADFILICSNTGHEGADIVQSNIKIPVMNIIDVTSKKLYKDNIKRIGLLGTKHTMERGFYRGRMANNYGIKVLIPKNKEDRTKINKIIYYELCVGKIQENSKLEYKRIVNDLIKNGAEAIVLGCTEIMLLIGDEHFSVPIYDSTSIHIESAVEFALSDVSFKEFMKG